MKSAVEKYRVSFIIYLACIRLGYIYEKCSAHRRCSSGRKEKRYRRVADMDLSLFLYLSELAGTVAFAVSGVLTAKKQRLDLFGAVVLGLTTAVGGGAVRGILLGYNPPVMFRKPVYAITAIITSLIVFLIEKKSRLLEDSQKLVLALNVADTIGLGVFAASGTEKVLGTVYCENMFLAAFVGTVTAVGGGILRDMLAGTIPVVMRRRVYAVAALLGSLIYYVLRFHADLPVSAAELISIGAICGIRFLAIRHLWNLPSF